MKPIQHMAALNRSRLRFKRMRDYAEAIVQAVQDPLAVLDSSLRIKSVNQAFCNLFNTTPAKTKSKFIYAMEGGTWKFSHLEPLLKELLAQNSSTPHLEVNSYFTGQKHKIVLLNARKIQGSVASEQLILLTIEDITERKRAEHMLEKLNESFKQDSLTDALTGLYNRRGFLTLGAQFLKIGRRMEKSVFVLFIDLDGLKQINDKKGHGAGDRALIKTSVILRKTFRQSDIMARMGGDEFAIVTIEHLPGSMATLNARLKRHSMQTGHETTVSFSVGVAHSSPKDICSLEELIAQADKAMYAEKQDKQEKKELTLS